MVRLLTGVAGVALFVSIVPAMATLTNLVEKIAVSGFLTRQGCQVRMSLRKQKYFSVTDFRVLLIYIITTGVSC